jgi:putative FmdB family regulatory protein
MPFYEYECQNCKFYSEIMQKITDPPMKKCPSCGKNTMKKLISAPAFRLKGAGWYETDFKSDKEDKRNLAVDKEPETAREPDPKAEKAAEAAPSDASKADAKSGADSKSAKPAAKPVTASKRRGAPAARRPARPKSKAKTRARRKARR